MRIVRTQRYIRDLRRLEASEDEVGAVERSIVANPAIGDVIPGLGGIRKLRFKLGNKGNAAADGRSTF